MNETGKSGKLLIITKKKYILISVFICAACFIQAITLKSQETIDTAESKYLDVSLTGGQIYQSVKTREIDLPVFFRKNPETFSSRCAGLRHISDNPLIHGALWINMNVNARYGGFGFTGGLTAEHRGISYGIYNTKNMIIFPRLRFSFDSSFSMAGENVRFGVSVGNYENTKLYEGLNIYNIDAQGSNWYIKWRWFKVEFHRIGNLDQVYGLNIDDTDDWIYSIENLRIYDSIFTDIRYGYYYYKDVNGLSKTLTGEYPSGNQYSFGIRYKDIIRLYGQFSNRLVDRDIPLNDKCAFLAGLTLKYDFSRLKLKATTEYRYYSEYYNKGFKNIRVSFRPETGECTGATIGESLYPLYLFNRPFSQWAVFTDYHNRDAEGLAFRFDGKFIPYKDFFIDFVLDYNYIKATGEQQFTYPFYNAGIGWEPFEGNFIKIGYTNKGMNMDKHYPTFYLYKEPAMQLDLNFNFSI